MTKKIDFFIGDVELTFGKSEAQKFIVSKYKSDLIYHARAICGLGFRHYQVAEQVGVNEEDIVGGGTVGYVGVRCSENNVLNFYGSSQFGEVPEEFFEMFSPQLLEVYKKIDPTIIKIRASTGYKNSLKLWLMGIF